jgi:hypothetical protein
VRHDRQHLVVEQPALDVGRLADAGRVGVSQRRAGVASGDRLVLTGVGGGSDLEPGRVEREVIRELVDRDRARPGLSADLPGRQDRPRLLEAAEAVVGRHLGVRPIDRVVIAIVGGLGRGLVRVGLGDGRHDPPGARHVQLGRRRLGDDVAVGHGRVGDRGGGAAAVADAAQQPRRRAVHGVTVALPRTTGVADDLQQAIAVEVEQVATGLPGPGHRAAIVRIGQRPDGLHGHGDARLGRLAERLGQQVELAAKVPVDRRGRGRIVGGGVGVLDPDQIGAPVGVEIDGAAQRVASADVDLVVELPRAGARRRQRVGRVSRQPRFVSGGRKVPRLAARSEVEAPLRRQRRQRRVWSRQRVVLDEPQRLAPGDAPGRAARVPVVADQVGQPVPVHVDQGLFRGGLVLLALSVLGVADLAARGTCPGNDVEHVAEVVAAELHEATRAVAAEHLPVAGVGRVVRAVDVGALAKHSCVESAIADRSRSGLSANGVTISVRLAHGVTQRGGDPSRSGPGSGPTPPGRPAGSTTARGGTGCPGACTGACRRTDRRRRRSTARGRRRSSRSAPPTIHSAAAAPAPAAAATGRRWRDRRSAWSRPGGTTVSWWTQTQPSSLGTRTSTMCGKRSRAIAAMRPRSIHLVSSWVHAGSAEVKCSAT